VGTRARAALIAVLLLVSVFTVAGGALTHAPATAQASSGLRPAVYSGPTISAQSSAPTCAAGSNTPTTSVTLSTTIGDLIYVVIGNDQNPATLPSVNDSQSNAYAVQENFRPYGSGSTTIRLFDVLATAGATSTDTITATFSGGEQTELFAFDVSGSAGIQTSAFGGTQDPSFAVKTSLAVTAGASVPANSLVFETVLAFGGTNLAFTATTGTATYGATDACSTDLTVNGQYDENTSAGTPNEVVSFASASSGAGGFLEVFVPVPPPTPATAPTGLSGSAYSTTQVQLSWTNPSGESLVDTTASVYTAACASFVGSVGLLGVNTSTIIDGLSPATGYCFTVYAVNGTGASPPATPFVNVTTSSGPAPGQPTSLLAFPISDVSIGVTWTNPTEGAGYALSDNHVLEYSAGCAALLFTFDESAVVTSASVGSLLPNTGYCFTATATNTNGTSLPATPYANTSTYPAPPTAPLNVSAITTSSSSIAVNWTAPTSLGLIVNYTLEFGTTAGLGTNVSVGTGLSYTLTGLADNTTFYFAVQAWTMGGGGVLSSTVHNTTLNATAGGGGGVPADNAQVFIFGILILGGSAAILAFAVASRRR